ALVLGGCGALDRVPRPAPRRREADADEPLVAAALADQQQVLATAVATRTAHAALAGTLDPVVEHHRAHVSVLGGTPATGTPTPSGTATSSSPATTAPPPADPAAALAALGEVERAAAEARGQDATTAASGDLARMLAAMSAGQAQHVVVLGAAVRTLQAAP
ncbi:MAG: hypothetical protein Q7T56_08335, partial [Nocardioidaceae bacterium]|nr:hypothetical protein [Nocardioidaceae bacterium]